RFRAEPTCIIPEPQAWVPIGHQAVYNKGRLEAGSVFQQPPGTGIYQFPTDPPRSRLARFDCHITALLRLKSGDLIANTYTLRQERRGPPTIQSGLATSC